MASKLCDSCKSATSTLYCQADSAFLCLTCDSNIHATNKLSSRHARVFLCEVCEQAPAHVTCKADAATLCVTCDRDIHSANPLARRHERVPATPVYGSAVTGMKANAAVSFFDESCFSDVEGDVSREEVEEAASWLLPNPKVLDSDPFLDFGYGSDLKIEAQKLNTSGTDCVVPVQNKGPLVHDNYYEPDFTGTKPCFGYGYNNHCFSQSVSSSSPDVGVVPDEGATTDVSTENQTVQRLSPVDREARVLRYREKRKNRKFEKTIRYASRKVYAEMRPRIKGRFVKRTNVDIDADRRSSCGFGNVLSS